MDSEEDCRPAKCIACGVRLTLMACAVAAQLVFEEMQESAGPGPFMMQTMLKDPDGNMLYRPGIGMVSHPVSSSHLA